MDKVQDPALAPPGQHRNGRPDADSTHSAASSSDRQPFYPIDVGSFFG